MEALTVAAARRLALARAGLLQPDWTGMPTRAAADERRAREAAHRVIRRFGYLQLDTVSVAGARSHAIVLLSRLEGLDPALARLAERGEVVPCALADGDRAAQGWVRRPDLELAARLERVRPRSDRGVLLSPFDPLLWDRQRVERLFGFRQLLEVFKPAARRAYGYFCLPVLAGERLVARVDLKAETREGVLRVLSRHTEGEGGAETAEAVRAALARFADALGLRVAGLGPR